MKVLITSKYDSDNIYIKTIVNNLKSSCNVICDFNLFWNSNLNFDIIHIQWPEELFGWNEIKKEDLNKLSIQLNFWKSKKTKILLTLHNMKPHKFNFLGDDLYEIIKKNADCIVHLGKYSLDNCKYNYKGVIIYHPGYHDIINNNKKEYSIEELKEQNNTNIFLTFGNIRHLEEENYIINAFLSAKKNKNKKLFISNPYQKKLNTFFDKIKYKLRLLYLNRKGVFFLHKKINNENISSLLQHVDALIIPRLNTLNSGVVFLGFTFSKFIIGPNIGNISEFLLKNRNPIFDPKNINSLIQIFNDFKKDENYFQVIEDNKKFIDYYCNSREIAKQHFDTYLKLLDNNIAKILN